MPRIKRSVQARKKRRKVLEQAKGYVGQPHVSYRKAKEAVLKADVHAYRDRKKKKRVFRRLFTRALYDQQYDNENSFGASYGEHRVALELPAEAWFELRRAQLELGALRIEVGHRDLLALPGEASGLPSRREVEHRAEVTTEAEPLYGSGQGIREQVGAGEP